MERTYRFRKSTISSRMEQELFIEYSVLASLYERFEVKQQPLYGYK